MAGMAELAGPIGIALAAYKALEALKDAITGTIEKVGAFSAALVSADPSPAAYTKTIGDATKGVADELFKVSPAVGIFVGALGAAASAVGTLMAAFDGMVERYRRYNPGLAAASAIGEVTQTLGDIRRAQEAAPALIQYVNTRTQIQQKYEDAKIEFINKIGPTLLTFMNLGVAALPYLSMILDVVTGILNFIPGIGANVNEINENARRQNFPDNWQLPTADVVQSIFGNIRSREGGVEIP